VPGEFVRAEQRRLFGTNAVPLLNAQFVLAVIGRSGGVKAAHRDACDSSHVYSRSSANNNDCKGMSCRLMREKRVHAAWHWTGDSAHDELAYAWNVQ
jgi:hypothetical protein